MTAAELLSVAAFAAGRHAQAFPSFGSERTGAPVAAFCRIDDRPIRLREPVLCPDALIVQDSTLLHAVDVFAGLAEDGLVLLNTQLPWERLGIKAVARDRVVLVPATQVALENIGRPVPNAALLGGFAALSFGMVTLDAVVTGIRMRFHGGIAEGNARAARQAYDMVSSAMRESARA